MDKLKNVPNLVVYNPMNDLLRLKKSEGMLYFRTDSHWNRKGAFLAYSGLLKRADLPIPDVEFELGSVHAGDLINISKLNKGPQDFPLHLGDNWNVNWKIDPIWSKKEILGQPKKNVIWVSRGGSQP